MSHRGIASPSELAFLNQALNDYCAPNGIVDRTEREDIAHTILRLFDSGVREDEMATRLKAELARR